MTGIDRAAVEAVLTEFPDGAAAEESDRGEAVVVVEPSRWPSIAKWLSDEGGFGFLSDLCGIDRLGHETRFLVVYVLTDLTTPRRLTVKVPLEGDQPKVPSVTSIWPTADWLEREAYDMFGITFEGHPDLRRILMPDEWEGYPLRKDYAMGKVPVEYKHLSPGG